MTSTDWARLFGRIIMMLMIMLNTGVVDGREDEESECVWDMRALAP